VFDTETIVLAQIDLARIGVVKCGHAKVAL
jgi:hypothetical protein